MLAITLKGLRKNLANFTCASSALLMLVREVIMLILVIQGFADLLGKITYNLYLIKIALCLFSIILPLFWFYAESLLDPFSAIII